MGVTSGIVVYVITWWLIFFMFLPLGVRAPYEIGETPETGHEPGAPTSPNLLMKVIMSTLVSFCLWGIIYWIIDSEIVSFRPN